MAAKIYTKTGDKGETSLFGGARLQKDNIRIEAYGTVDELNAVTGYLYELTIREDVRPVLIAIQNKLFNMGSLLATDPTKNFDMPGLSDDDISLLEREIDRMEETLPELKQFILPSGHTSGAYAHIARTVCRRTERRVVTLSAQSEVKPVIITYLNRLSDYYFTLARYLTMREGGEERKWDKDL